MSSPSRPPERQRARLRVMLLVAALLLPALSLIPLGSLWLWQKGYVLYWAIATCVVVTSVYVLLSRSMRPLLEAQPAPPQEDLPRAIWTQRQEEAWKAVQDLAGAVSPERLTGRDEILRLGLETVSVVAKRMHPERGDPLLHFTLPEAFAVIEQASAGLREFVETHLPFGDRITVTQMMWVYRWRGILPVLEKGYDIWRLVRLVNPISAATQELRERYTRQIYQMGREHVAKRLAAAFVKEVGKAAIDLYGGNLRVSGRRLSEHVSDASTRDATELDAVAAEPIRILVLGETGAGKSSLINLLTNSVDADVDVLPITRQRVAYRIAREGLPAALLIDTPGLGSGDSNASLALEAEDCDMVVLVSAAPRAARARDRDVLDVLQRHFEAMGRRRPPVLVALTQIDRLRPFGDWSPPIDVVGGGSEKAKSVRGAMEAAARELDLDVGRVVPMRVDSAQAAYNVDALWAKIMEALPEAKRSRLQRCLKGAAGGWNWSTVLTRAANAGRVLSRVVLQRE